MGDRSASGRRPVIVADDAIAALREAMDQLGEVRALPGRAIDRAALAEADALLVRTVTRVDAALVAGTPVRFVGSATAGLDHVDTAGLRALGIEVAHAPGCNATAVTDVVLAALATLEQRGIAAFPPRGPVGIVGFGAIGRRLALRLRALGTEVLACDPPLARSRSAPDEIDPALAAMVPAERFVDLDELLAASRIVTLHVPLVATGPCPTRHLLDGPGLGRLAPGTIVINTPRGGVLDDAALLDWLKADRGTAVLDVWETEPAPPQALVDRVAIATPHVAGYSLDGKLEATRRIHVALARALGLAPTFVPAHHLPPAPALAPMRTCTLASALTAAIDLAGEDTALRHALAQAGTNATARATAFERLRRAHPLRRELGSFTLVGTWPTDIRDALRTLGLRHAAV